MTIETMQEKELVLFFKYLAEEGWDIEKAHIIALYKVHPQDFFIAYNDELLLGFIVAIKHSNEFGFISSFLVLKKFRGKGFGKKIFNFALQHLESCQIALDSDTDKTQFYENVGFKSYFDVITYCYETGKIMLPSSSIETINFDEHLALLMDNSYISSIVSEDSVNYKAIKNSSIISSCAFTFAYKDGYKIHIESCDINEAITLFFALTNEFKKGTKIYLQATKLSPLLLALTETLQMYPLLKSIRMYNKILD